MTYFLILHIAPGLVGGLLGGIIGGLIVGRILCRRCGKEIE